MINITYPEKFAPFVTQKARRKIAKGGRGSAKSRSFAKLAIVRASRERLRFLCCREIQGSIKDSVHKLLCDTISELKLDKFFRITEVSIKSWTGSEFIFKGLRNNVNEIKSLEGIDICWIEEGEGISQDSIDILLPTIRSNKDPEVWVSFNPETRESPCNRTFVLNAEPDSIVIEMNWRDNPWFPEELRRQKDWCKQTDPEKYDWVWEGKYKKYAEDLIFRTKLEVDCEFEAPGGTRHYYGLDFGFSNDPLSAHRMFIKDRCLYIEYEVYGRGIELDDIHRLLIEGLPGVARNRVKADSARPDTISFLRRPFEKNGVYYPSIDCVGAEKAKGSVEDGIDFLRNFEKIFIHKRCPGAKEDYQNYRWKRDRNTNEILSDPVDKSNHAPDDNRYALEDLIKSKVSSFDVL